MLMPTGFPTVGPMDAGRLDVVVIGGGAAGRSAALVLGRARRSVAVVDEGQPSNRVSTGIGGYLGHDQRNPLEFYEATRDELARYPTVSWVEGAVESLERDDHGWTAGLGDGSTLAARHVVLAMGMRYDTPDIAGIDHLWGASVFHCPFCHGWEHRDEPLLVLADSGPHVTRVAPLLRNWTDDVTVVAPPGTVADADRDVLRDAGIPVVDGEVVALRGHDRQLEGAELADGTVVPARGMLLAAPHRQRTGLVEKLGVELDDSGHVVVDESGQTNLDGLWAAGDLTSPMAMVVRVAAAGANTAVWIVHDLVLGHHDPR